MNKRREARGGSSFGGGEMEGGGREVGPVLKHFWEHLTKTLVVGVLIFFPVYSSYSHTQILSMIITLTQLKT